jgi:hypothetical protein
MIVMSRSDVWPFSDAYGSAVRILESHVRERVELELEKIDRAALDRDFGAVVAASETKNIDSIGSSLGCPVIPRLFLSRPCTTSVEVPMPSIFTPQRSQKYAEVLHHVIRAREFDRGRAFDFGRRHEHVLDAGVGCFVHDDLGLGAAPDPAFRRDTCALLRCR